MDSIQNNQEETTNQPQSEQPEKDQFVPKKAYEEVTGDMHKFKGKAKELEARINEYEAKLEAIENEKLAEQGKWQELAQVNQEKLEKLAQERDAERSKFIDYHKKQAVISSLGGFKKDEYAGFVNVSSISVDENGVPDRDEVQAEADRIRANHPELLKSNVSETLPPDAPSRAEGGISKDWSQMSQAERIQARRELLQNKSNQ